MRSFLNINSIIALACVGTSLVTSTSIRILPKKSNRARDTTPNLPFDPNTIKSCSYWWDTDGSFDCLEFLDFAAISLAELIRWVCLFIYFFAASTPINILCARTRLLQQLAGTSKPLVNRTALRPLVRLFRSPQPRLKHQLQRLRVQQQQHHQ